MQANQLDWSDLLIIRGCVTNPSPGQVQSWATATPVHWLCANGRAASLGGHAQYSTLSVSHHERSGSEHDLTGWLDDIPTSSGACLSFPDSGMRHSPDCLHFQRLYERRGEINLSGGERRCQKTHEEYYLLTLIFIHFPFIIHAHIWEITFKFISYSQRNVCRQLAAARTLNNPYSGGIWRLLRKKEKIMIVEKNKEFCSHNRYSHNLYAAVIREQLRVSQEL